MGHNGRVLKPGHAAEIEARTLFPNKRRLASNARSILKSGHNQRKIGKRVMKGRWRGMLIFCLTLEERATCPQSCRLWLACYGNNMPYAERIEADDEFEHLLWFELAALQRRYPKGFVVRLHILGDFYSGGYVLLWQRALDRFPALRVFGYTARDPNEDRIGRMLWQLATERWDRFAIRFSGLAQPTMGAVTVAHGADTSHLVCPAQTGATECCATCGFCWHSQRTIAFREHHDERSSKAIEHA